MEVLVDFDSDTLTIIGTSFGGEDTPMVTLGSDLTPLPIISHTDTEIVAGLPAVGDGGYRLIVSTGPSPTNYDQFDLIIGAVGPQGEQGKLGPQGEQGKAGPSGNQGPQGKAGPPGDQGPQGKSGPQGAQGKLGDQGPQGKSGPQGPQGKAGPPGDQGPQGPQGKEGPPGPT